MINHQLPMHSHLHLVVGCMFSGKTDFLIRQSQMLQQRHVSIQVFKPQIDNRYIADRVCSHNGKSIAATTVVNARALQQRLKPNVHTIFIDELQFFDVPIIRLINHLVSKRGVNVVATAIERDFRNEPFTVITHLKQQPLVKTTKLFGVCEVCGAQADYIQRRVNGQPSRYEEPVIMVGGQELYAPRCKMHHVVIRN